MTTNTTIIPAPTSTITDLDARTVEYSWVLADRPWDGEADSQTRVMLVVSHDRDRKTYRAFLSREGVTRRDGYSIRHAHIAPGEGMTINREAAPRYSRKRFQAFAAESFRELQGTLAGRNGADIRDAAVELMAGRNFRTGR